jgi:hypothetical protein
MMSAYFFSAAWQRNRGLLSFKIVRISEEGRARGFILNAETLRNTEIHFYH